MWPVQWRQSMLSIPMAAQITRPTATQYSNSMSHFLIGTMMVSYTLGKLLAYWIPSPWFPVYIKNIHRTKHGSDSEVYDTEGRFVPYKFEEIFTKFAKSDKNRLTFHELMEMTKAMRNTYDLFGWIANKGEWSVTFWLLKDKEGFLSKEAIRGMYDGSIFEKIARENKLKKQK